MLLKTFFFLSIKKEEEEEEVLRSFMCRIIIIQEYSKYFDPAVINIRRVICLFISPAN